MKPVDVIELIREHNNSFSAARDEEYFQSHKEKQTPIITLLTCSDSRIQSSVLLPDPVNMIFTVENIGNQVSTCEGSLDYGILHLETPLLLIAGHSDCGAIKAYIGGYSGETPGIKKELDGLKPVFSENDSKQVIFDRIISNIKYQVNQAVEKYHGKVEAGELAVAGAYYDFANDFGKGHGRLVFISINGQDQDF